MIGGILTGDEIARRVRRGEIGIDPFSDEQLNPASYDLRLGRKVRVYERVVYDEHCGYGNGVSRDDGSSLTPIDSRSLDAASNNPSTAFDMSEDGFTLRSGIGYLMHTAETISPGQGLVAVVEGKSSLGRLFLSVHHTAGYVDPGFRGQVTLEVSVVHPVKVYPGMRFCQVRFMPTLGEPWSYQASGNYVGEHALGPVASRSYVQVEKDRKAGMPR